MGKIRKVKSYKILLEMSVLSRQVPTDLTQLFFDVQVCSPMKWRRTSRSVLAVSPVIFFALSRSRGRSCCRGQAASNWKLAVDLASRIKGTWGDLTQQGTICLDSFGRCWKSLWPIYDHLWSSMMLWVAQESWSSCCNNCHWCLCQQQLLGVSQALKSRDLENKSPPYPYITLHCDALCLSHLISFYLIRIRSIRINM